MVTDFVIPKIQPDELLAGYRGRIASWNGCRSTAEVVEAMVALYPAAGRWASTTMQFIEAAALANDLQAETLIRRHSTYVLRAKSHRRELLAVQGNYVLASQASMAIYSHTKRIMGCMVCMRADAARLQYSFWRRSHQIPGRLNCPIHASPLVYAEESLLLPGGPASCERLHPLPAEAAQVGASGAECPDFVVAMLEAMVVKFRRPEHKAAVAQIRAALKARGIDASDARDRRSLQAQLLDRFPPAWLAMALSTSGVAANKLKNKVARTLHPTIACSAIDLAMVASLAFTDLRSALVTLGLNEVDAAPAFVSQQLAA